MVMYENQQTLEKETAAKEAIERSLNIFYRKLPMQYQLDFAAINDVNEVVHWAELKCRDFEHTKYEHYVLSFEKILKARELSSATELPSYLYLTFTDNVCLRARIDDVTNWHVKWGGRTVKKRREADVHPGGVHSTRLVRQNRNRLVVAVRIWHYRVITVKCHERSRNGLADPSSVAEVFHRDWPVVVSFLDVSCVGSGSRAMARYERCDGESGG